VRLLGPMPTPAIAYLTRTLRASAGIVISASHNPYYDNGIKFFSAGGEKLPDEVELEIEAMLDQPMTTVASEALGKVKRIEDARGRYIEFCKSTIPSRLSLKGLRVVVDCANGASYHIAPDVFRELGADVIAVGNEPDGLNINEGVGATHPENLAAVVKELRADIGISLDGDGDRLVMVDANGEIRDGDEVLYVLALSRLSSNAMRGDVVGTLMTNLGLEVALKEKGIGLSRVNVGDRYILEKLLKEDWVIGGEPSGHIICLDRTTTGDGIVSALQVLAEMNKTGKSLAELCSGMTKYPQVLINVKLVDAVAKEIMQKPQVIEAVAAVEAEMGGSGRVLLRPSGTEPLIRVMVEGSDADLVQRKAEQIADAVRSTL